MKGANPLGLRHCPSGFSTKPDQLQPFSAYVTQTREVLNRVHACSIQAALRAEGNAPFELFPDEGKLISGGETHFRRGVLLIHGLTDSPYFMRQLALFFQEQGFRVMAVLLPGHGTCPGDLLDVRWEDWARTVAYGVDSLSREADELYLAGLSLGGALSVLHSLQDERVRGMYLFAPALSVSPFAAFANLHELYSWLVPSAKWVDIMPDEDLYKYESFPKNAAFQMHALTRRLSAELHGRRIDIPVFTAASADDKTINVAAILEFMKHASHPGNQLVYYTRTPDKELPGMDRKRVERVNSVVPEQNLLSYSHLSLVLPPDDPHYGMHGEYANCLHYYPKDMDRFNACKSNLPDIRLGEVTEENLRGGIMRRLMYNPHFERMKNSMRSFIKGIP